MKINYSIKFNFKNILLAILIFLVLINNFIWLKINMLPPQGNALNDLFPAINLYLDIIHTRATRSEILNIFTSFSSFKIYIFNTLSYIKRAFPIYPPLVSLSYAVFYLLFGPYTKMELMVSSIYLAIALCSIYGIGKKLLNEKAGLLAAFIFSSFPGVIQVSRYTYAEFFSMCLTALTLYLLLKTDFLQNRKYSLLLGIALGLTALTKWDFPPALIGPFILTLWKANIVSDKNQEHSISRVKVWKNLIFAILIGLLISSFWYVLNFDSIIGRFNWDDENAYLNRWMSHNKLLFLIELITYYPLTTINVHLRLFYSFLFILIVIVLIYKIIKNRGQLYLLSNQLFYMLFFASWIIIPYMSFTLTKILNPSHIMLVLPAIAIIAGIGVISFRNKVIKVALICLIILYGSYSHLHSFFDFKKLEPFYNLKLYLYGNGRLGLVSFKDDREMRDSWETASLYPPDPGDWKIKDILSFIKEDSRKIGHKPIVLVLTYDVGINAFAYEYYNLLGNYQLYIEPRANDRSEYPLDRSRFEYVVVNSSGNIMDENFVKGVINSLPNYQLKDYGWGEFMNNFFKRNKYKLTKEYLLPNHTKTMIYKLIYER